MSKLDFLVNTVAADLDSTYAKVLDNRELMALLITYMATEDMTYEQLLVKANEHKSSLRR